MPAVMTDSEHFCSSITDHFRVDHVCEESVVVEQRHSGQRLVFLDGVLEGKPEGKLASMLVAKIFDHHEDPDILAAITGAMKHAFDNGINCAEPVETKRSQLAHVARFHKLVFAPTADSKACNVEMQPRCASPEDQEQVQAPPSKKKRQGRRVCDENFCLVYVMTVLPGRPFSALIERTDHLRFCLGHQVGLLSKALQVSMCKTTGRIDVSCYSVLCWEASKHSPTSQLAHMPLKVAKEHTRVPSLLLKHTSLVALLMLRCVRKTMWDMHMVCLTSKQFT